MCSSVTILHELNSMYFSHSLVRHEAALWRPDRQHMSGEDNQPGQAYRDLQPGCSESRQGNVIPHVLVNL